MTGCPYDMKVYLANGRQSTTQIMTVTRDIEKSH